MKDTTASSTTDVEYTDDADGDRLQKSLAKLGHQLPEQRKMSDAPVQTLLGYLDTLSTARDAADVILSRDTGDIGSFFTRMHRMAENTKMQSSKPSEAEVIKYAQTVESQLDSMLKDMQRKAHTSQFAKRAPEFATQEEQDKYDSFVLPEDERDDHCLRQATLDAVRSGRTGTVSASAFDKSLQTFYNEHWKTTRSSGEEERKNLLSGLVTILHTLSNDASKAIPEELRVKNMATAEQIESFLSLMTDPPLSPTIVRVRSDIEETLAIAKMDKSALPVDSSIPDVADYTRRSEKDAGSASRSSSVDTVRLPRAE
jgi:hypothetical protein